MSRAFAPPVSSPPFFYSGTSGLYVEIDHNRHSRSSSDSIHALLTYKDPGPALTKAGKPKVHQPPPHKDQPAHFYTAQLLLYGLKPLKSKQAAKKALLAALNGVGGLTVPEDVRKIERDLAAEYEVKNAAAEKEYRKEKLLRKETEAKERKRRRRDEDDLLAELHAPSQKKSKSNKVLVLTGIITEFLENTRTHYFPTRSQSISTSAIYQAPIKSPLPTSQMAGIATVP